MSNLVNVQTEVTKVTIKLSPHAAAKLRDLIGKSYDVDPELLRVYGELADLGIGYEPQRSIDFAEEAHVSHPNAQRFGLAISVAMGKEVNVWQVKNHLRKYIASDLAIPREAVDVHIVDPKVVA
jgi:hypothetical protein